MLHTRSFSGTGQSFLHFLAACYLTFTLEHANVIDAWVTLPPITGGRGPAGGGADATPPGTPGTAASGGSWTPRGHHTRGGSTDLRQQMAADSLIKLPSVGRSLTPSQQRCDCDRGYISS